MSLVPPPASACAASCWPAQPSCSPSPPSSAPLGMPTPTRVQRSTLERGCSTKLGRAARASSAPRGRNSTRTARSTNNHILETSAAEKAEVEAERSERQRRDRGQEPRRGQATRLRTDAGARARASPRSTEAIARLPRRPRRGPRALHRRQGAGGLRPQQGAARSRASAEAVEAFTELFDSKVALAATERRARPRRRPRPPAPAAIALLVAALVDRLRDGPLVLPPHPADRRRRS